MRHQSFLRVEAVLMVGLVPLGNSPVIEPCWLNQHDHVRDRVSLLKGPTWPSSELMCPLQRTREKGKNKTMPTEMIALSASSLGPGHEPGKTTVRKAPTYS